MDFKHVCVTPRRIFGLSRQELIVAITAYLRKKGCAVKSGKAYVVGLEHCGTHEDDTVLALIAEDIRDIMKLRGASSTGRTVKEVIASGRIPGQQKFELTHKGVREAMIAFCEEAMGKPIPDGPIMLWGLDEPVRADDHSSGERTAVALTFFVDPF